MVPCSFQFGNTCYSNSVLQALYFCKPFRDKVLEYKAKNKRSKETLLTCLADLGRCRSRFGRLRCSR